MIVSRVSLQAIYGADVDAVWLGIIVLRPAAAAAAEALRLRDALEAANQQEVTHFDVATNLDDDAARGSTCSDAPNNVSDCDSLDPSRDFSVHLASCTWRIFGVPSLWPR